MPLSHSHSLSQILAWVFIGFWLKFDFKKTLFLISLLQEQPHIWRNNFWGRISFLFCQHNPNRVVLGSFLFILVASMKGVGRKISGAFKKMTGSSSSCSRGGRALVILPSLHQHQQRWTMNKTNLRRSKLQNRKPRTWRLMMKTHRTLTCEAIANVKPTP